MDLVGARFRSVIHFRRCQRHFIHVFKIVLDRISRRAFTRFIFLYPCQEKHPYTQFNLLRKSNPFTFARKELLLLLISFQCVTSLVMLLISDAYVLINYYGQILWLSVAASIAGMLWLRHKHPDAPRPIRVNTAIPVIFLLCCIFLVVFPIPTQPWNTVIGAAITLSGT